MRAAPRSGEAPGPIYARMMTPTTAGWEAGGREIVCYLFAPEAGSTTEALEPTTSLRNAAR